MVSVFSYELLQRAEKEYFDSFLWYEEQQDGLGERFALAVRRKLQELSVNPFLGSNKKGLFRESNLEKPFPFLIIFFIDHEENKVVVTSFFSYKKEPEA